MKPVEDPLSPSPYIPDDDHDEEQIEGRHGTNLSPSSSSLDEEEAAAAAATASSVQQQDVSFNGCQEEAVVEDSAEPAKTLPLQEEELGDEDSCVREKIKRHRTEVAGRVWIPEIWGQEELLKDWTDCSAFDAALRSNGLMSARDALVRQGLTTHDTMGLSTVGNRC